ncbi:MAG: cobaltochelatase subunit CobT, partial [Sphingomonadaceae bacterium]
MAEPDRIEALRQALAASTRALGEAPDADLAFTADRPRASGSLARVPQPARTLPPEQVAEARGWADAYALRRRLHDARAHAALAPPAGPGREAFDAIEQARVEALGAAEMAGVAANLARMT